MRAATCLRLVATRDLLTGGEHLLTGGDGNFLLGLPFCAFVFVVVVSVGAIVVTAAQENSIRRFFGSSGAK
jgi:hypothetical protein